MAFLLPAATGFAQAAGLGQTQLGQGLAGLADEQSRLAGQVRVLGVLVFTLVLGIIATILLSTSVSHLETIGEYFKTTGHQVGLGFAGATIVMLFVSFVMAHNATECAEEDAERLLQQQPQQQPQLQPAAVYEQF